MAPLQARADKHISKSTKPLQISAKQFDFCLLQNSNAFVWFCSGTQWLPDGTIEVKRRVTPVMMKGIVILKLDQRGSVNQLAGWIQTVVAVEVTELLVSEEGITNVIKRYWPG